MNSHWQGAGAEACDALEPGDAARHLGGIAPIAMDGLKIGGALMRAIPHCVPTFHTTPVRNLRWARGSGHSAELFLVSGSDPFSARQNVVNTLSRRLPLTADDMSAAAAALGRLKGRESEDVEAWASRLAVDLGGAGE